MYCCSYSLCVLLLFSSVMRESSAQFGRAPGLESCVTAREERPATSTSSSVYRDGLGGSVCACACVRE